MTPASFSVFKPRLVSLTLFPCLMTSGCSGDAARPSLESAASKDKADSVNPTTLNPRTFIVELDPGADLEVEPDALVFSGVEADASVRRSAGDIVVGSQGEGFLREVVSVEDDGAIVTLRTRDAFLDDVVVEGEFHESFRPLSEPLSRSEGDVWRSAVTDQGGYVQLNRTKLLTDGSLSVEASGGIGIDPTMHFDATFSGAQVDSFELSVDGQFDADLSVLVRNGGYAKVSHKLLKLWESPRYVWTGFIGPVPVVVTTSVEVSADASVSVDGPLEVELGGVTSSQLQLSAELKDDAWTLGESHDFDVLLEGPFVRTEAETDIKVSLAAKLKVRLYDVAGPWVSVKPGVQFSIDGPHDARSWSGELGVEGKFGVAAEFPVKTGVGFEGEFFEAWWPFANGGFGGPTGACGAPFSGALTCNGGLLESQIDTLQDCIRWGGGAACLISGRWPACGDLSGGGYVCEMNALFDCLCREGGTACAASYCELGG